MSHTYEDFILVVDGQPGAYTVAAQGPAQIRVPPEPFIYKETTEIKQTLARIEHGFAPERKSMWGIGKILYQALFPRSIIAAYNRAMEMATKLRLKLIIRPPALRHLPWELLVDDLNGRFLADRLSGPLVHTIEKGEPAPLLTAPNPLKLLYVQANPAGTDPLEAQNPLQAIQDGLGDAAQVTSLFSARPGSLQAQLRQDDYHILHYDGHAQYDAAAGGGALILHDAQGGQTRLSGETLATYLDGLSIRLVVLSACETSKERPLAAEERQFTEKRFTGIAQQLIDKSNLPAVVAMQYEIPESSALAFTEQFYQALADNYPVDAAVVEGRKAINALFEQPYNNADWATPALYMRTQDGHIFAATSGKEDASPDDSPRVEIDNTFHIGQMKAGQVFQGGEQSFTGPVEIDMRETTISDVDGPVSVGGDAAGGDIYQAGGDLVQGDKVEMSGDFRGALVNVRSRLQNVTQTIEALPHGTDEQKQAFNQLVEALQAELAQLPEARADEAEQVAKRVEALVGELEEEDPDAEEVAISGESLKRAAKNIADLLPTVIGLATSIADAAFHFG